MPLRPHARKIGAVLLAVALLFAIHERQTAAAAGPKIWLVPRYVLDALGKDPVSASYFRGARTYMIVRPGGVMSPPDGFSATPTVSYRSYADIQAAFADGSAPKSGAILYDNEKWSFTPDDEKADPAHYEALAAQLVHAHGLAFISTPAVALSAALDRGPGTIADKYLRLGIPRDAARNADIVDIQAQSLQYDPAAYAALVSAAAAQARAANPHVLVVAGLTTGRNHPDGSGPTSDDLVRAVQATRSVVDGYWLNVPSPGADCPQCSAFRPDLAIDFLHHLGGP